MEKTTEVVFMYGYGMMGGFPILFLLVYLLLVGYFFYLLTSINNSLKRIAKSLEGAPAPGRSSERSEGNTTN